MKYISIHPDIYEHQLNPRLAKLTFWARIHRVLCPVLDTLYNIGLVNGHSGIVLGNQLDLDK